MAVLSFLTSAVGGTIMGSAIRWAESYLETRKLRVESELELQKLQVMSTIKLDESQMKLMSDAIKATTTSTWVPNEKTPPWLHYAFGLAEVTIKLVRPMMVLVSMGLIAWIFNSEAITGPEKHLIVLDILAYCFSVGYFWLGQRYQEKARNTSKK